MKIKQILILFVSGYILVGLLSCAVYTPNVVNTPLLRHKGETAISAHAGNGFHLQGAHAISHNVGIMANYMGVADKVVSDNITRKGTGNFFEVGLGYYSAYYGQRGVFELYGGAGIGNVNIKKSGTGFSTKDLEARITRYFIQPSFGGRWKLLEIAFTPRITAVNYNNLKTTYTQADLEADKFQYLENHPWVFIEPSLTLRAGFAGLKAQIQFGHSFKFSNDELGFDPGFINAGLMFRF